VEGLIIENTTEGEEKPTKCPLVFRSADLVLANR
jgi:Ni2+-binding GTPase involved in maturation of urease and hydrogenase